MMLLHGHPLEAIREMTYEEIYASALLMAECLHEQDGTGQVPEAPPGSDPFAEARRLGVYDEE